MHTELYLDTARLGRMCSTARKAEHDFGKLASQSGSSLYFERFLTNGFHVLPRRLRREVNHLNSWTGISGLKTRIRRFLGARKNSPVLLASRSAHLMTLAAHCLFRRCRNVMTTDAEWPPYLLILQRVATQTNRRLTVLANCELLLQDQESVAAFVNRLAEAYNSSHCDGVFISDITYFGVRIPVRKLVEQLRSSSTPPQFVAVDGAQALNHVPCQLNSTISDVYLSGTHKWLRAYLPLSIACFCNDSSVEFISDTVSECRRDGILDDQLLDFCLAAENDDFQSFGETVNVAPLFTAAAALKSAGNLHVSARLKRRQENLHRFLNTLRHSPWTPIRLCEIMRTAAILLRSRCPTRQTVPSNQLRSQFHSKGICLSAYDDGYVRVSMPSREFSKSDLRTIRRAFSK